MEPQDYIFSPVTSWKKGNKNAATMLIKTFLCFLSISTIRLTACDLVVGVTSPGGFFIFLWQQTNTDLSSWQRSALLEYFIIPALSLGITDGLPDITINYTPLLLSPLSTLLYKQTNHCTIIGSEKLRSRCELISEWEESVKIVRWLSA